MFYESDIQRALVHRMLDRGMEHFDRLRSVVLDIPDAERVGPVDDFLLRVSQRLLILALFFKHPAFASEEEWRVFKVETADNTTNGLKFSTRGGAITPYVELAFDPSLISEIRCSPGPWSRSVLHAVERLAKSLGNVNVTRSDLPL